ncbi:MAG: RHS repeat domain-containing protein, partial [Patescibacteria group bacterium]|nr:RHS repeat domain-containing protein [Patescibacteria group bacterium]
RAVSMADTQEQAEGKNRQTVYDAHGNVVGTTDAKGQSASSAFDARDRRVNETDRLAGNGSLGQEKATVNTGGE